MLNKPKNSKINPKVGATLMQVSFRSKLDELDGINIKI